jgi:pimeloyl-ACP methyl ester carboxylesterase
MRPRLSLVLVLALTIALIAACGNGNGNGEPTTVPTAPTGANPGPTPQPTEPAAPAEPLDPADFRLLGAYTGDPHTIADPAFDALSGATAHYGTLGNAAYRIEFPDDWNGELILYAHGFRGFERDLTIDNPRRALREELIGRGYAWAASSYSENGYVPGIGADDTLALYFHFAQEFEEPERAYLVGVSMGGNVAALSLEHFDGVYDGALALCGALGGQTQIDYLVSWARLAEYFAEVPLPVGDGASATQLGSVLLTDYQPALGTPRNPTAAGERFLSAVRELTGGARPFFIEGLEEQYIANFGLLLADPRLETVLARAATNDYVVYDIDSDLGLNPDELNEGIVRQSADPEARNAESYPDKVPTSGRLTAPMLALHNTGDLFVPITQAMEYDAFTRQQGNEDLFVVRAIRAPGHCNFSDEEVLAAFEDLVAWVEDGDMPGGDDLGEDLMEAGRDFTNPERPNDPGTP